MNKEMELLRIFRVAAESSSFRDAAVRLGTSPQGVTRAIQQLEQHYGEVLFHRSTRQVRITAFGEGLLDQVRPALERFEDLWRTPGSDQQASLSGTVRITAPHSLGTRAVLPALERVAARHPGITLDVRLSDRISNTVDEGIDVGIRVGFMRDSRFVARKAADKATTRYRDGKPLSIVDGMPIVIKDLYEVKGMPTELGSPAMKGYGGDKDCAHARVLRDGGAGDQRRAQDRRCGAGTQQCPFRKCLHGPVPCSGVGRLSAT